VCLTLGKTNFASYDEESTNSHVYGAYLQYCIVWYVGNMWAQEWTDIYDLVAPYPEVDSVDVTSSLSRANYSALRMFREAESFFTSLGLEPMTDEFWNSSMYERPDDGRQVTCHASAHDLFTHNDFRYDHGCIYYIFFWIPQWPRMYN